MGALQPNRITRKNSPTISRVLSRLLMFDTAPYYQVYYLPDLTIKPRTCVLLTGQGLVA